MKNTNCTIGINGIIEEKGLRAGSAAEFTQEEIFRLCIGVSSTIVIYGKKEDMEDFVTAARKMKELLYPFLTEQNALSIAKMVSTFAHANNDKNIADQLEPEINEIMNRTIENL